MAQCVESARDFILGSFPVIVGSLASEDAEFICQKNNLSFVELIRPFCQLSSDVYIHDPVNPSIVIPVKNWKVRVIDIQAPLPSAALVRRVLGEVVNKSIGNINKNSQLPLEKQITVTTPWYEAFRDCFFQLIQPMPHEFLRDFLSCIIVVSTKHPDPMHAFAALSSRQNNIQHSGDQNKKEYRWFSDNTLKYYLLLHDQTDGNDKKAEAVYQSMASVYGTHTCFLLKINSVASSGNKSKDLDDVWSRYIYPFSEETMDVTECDVEKSSQSSFTQVEADRKEEEIITELESIDKEIEQSRHSRASLTFNDPLTNMHYDDVLDDNMDDLVFTPTAASLPRLSERKLQLQEARNSLKQFSYSLVPTSSTELHFERGQCLNKVDEGRICEFIFQFLAHALLPHMEKHMRAISEQILARRGIHKSIFHATKKWFGGNKTAGGYVGFNQGASYTNDSTELQYRRLGDLSFLVQHYELAYNSYHSAKREFNNDHAWLYFAGALEMAAVSVFMQNSTKVYPVHYFEASISTYLNTCRMPEYATRACLMSTEALKTMNMCTEAAIEFIKITNEDSDLRSALLLEQAAHCFLRNKPPMLRKYAFHMILAGHRFSKAVQRRHALRCYVNALQVYEGKGWHLAEDHVNFIIGRQSFNLGNMTDAQEAYKCLLMYKSEQPLAQQASHLREFLTVFKKNQQQPSSGPLLPLPLPKAISSSVRCIPHMRELPQPPQVPPSSRCSRSIQAGVYSFQKSYARNYINRWAELEKALVTLITGETPYPFKPYVPCLSRHTSNKTQPIIAAGERFAYEVVCENPLKIPLNLLNVTLLWRFQPANDTTVSYSNQTNCDSKCIEAEVIADVLIGPNEKKPMCLQMTARECGDVEVVGLKYKLSSVAVVNPDYLTLKMNAQNLKTIDDVGVIGMLPLNVLGPRLNSNKEDRNRCSYAVDMRMKPQILPALPLLEATFHSVPLTLLCGEMQEASLQLKNVGLMAMENLHLLCNKPALFTFDGYHDNKLPVSTLLPSDDVTFTLYLRGFQTAGVHEVDFLFYYEPCEPVKQVAYRLLQHTVRVQTLSTISLHVTSQTSQKKDSVTTTQGNRLNNSELMLSLVAENRSQTTMNLRYNEFTLRQLFCYSTKWRLANLLHMSSETFTLRVGETVRLYLKTQTIENQANDDITVSVVPLSPPEETTGRFPTMQLFTRDIENMKAVDQSVGLVLDWQTFYIDESFTRHVIAGQSYAVLSKEVNMQSVIAEHAEQDISEGVCVTFDYPSIVKHSFTKTRLCVISVEVQCCNFTTCDVDIEFETEDLQDNERTEMSARRTSSLIQWIGALQHVVTVARQSTVRTRMRCVVTSPGVYELSNIDGFIVNRSSELDDGEIGNIPLSLPCCQYICVQEVELC